MALFEIGKQRSILIRVYVDDEDDSSEPIHPELVLSDFLANPEAYRVELIDEELSEEVSRLQATISEPVRSFGTPELIAWADRLQEIIAEYPEEERGDIPFVMTMSAHLEKFVKALNSPTIREKDARIAELEEALRPFAEMGPAFVECETLKGQILVILQRDDVEKARAVFHAKDASKEGEDEVSM